LEVRDMFINSIKKKVKGAFAALLCGVKHRHRENAPKVRFSYLEKRVKARPA
jgi:hypothetical protein